MFCILQKKGKKAVGFLLVLSLVFSPLSVNFDAFTSLAEENQNNSVLFYSENNYEDFYNEDILNNDTKYAKKVQEALNNGMKVSLSTEIPNEFDGYSAYVFPYKLVKKNKSLRKQVVNAYNSGKKVYLYGQKLTFKKYSKVLNVENVAINSRHKGKQLVFFDKKHEKIKRKKTKRAEKKNFHNIIGYTNDSSATSKLFVNNITNVSKQGKKTDLKTQIVLRNAIEQEAKSFMERLAEKDKIIENSTSSAAIKLKSQGDITSTADYGVSRAGVADNEYYLYIHDTPGGADDDFSVKHRLSFTFGESGWRVNSIDADHNLTYSSDNLNEALPDSTDSRSFELTLGLPYSIEVSTTFNDEVNIERYIQTTEEWVDWNITDYSIDPGNPIEFTSGWQGHRYAGTELHTNVQFRSGIDVVTDADQEINIFVDSLNY